MNVEHCCLSISKLVKVQVICVPNFITTAHVLSIPDQELYRMNIELEKFMYVLGASGYINILLFYIPNPNANIGQVCASNKKVCSS